MLVSITVWQAVLLEPQLALSHWRLEVRPHIRVPYETFFFPTQSYTKENSSCTTHTSTAGPLFSEAPVDVTANVGENITLPCIARGFPQPTVTWRRQDGRQILARTESHSKAIQTENGHLLIQSELAVKHDHSKKLWCSEQAKTPSWFTCTDWHDFQISIYRRGSTFHTRFR